MNWKLIYEKYLHRYPLTKYYNTLVKTKRKQKVLFYNLFKNEYNNEVREITLNEVYKYFIDSQNLLKTDIIFGDFIHQFSLPRYNNQSGKYISYKIA